MDRPKTGLRTQSKKSDSRKCKKCGASFHKQSLSRHMQVAHAKKPMPNKPGPKKTGAMKRV